MLLLALAAGGGGVCVWASKYRLQTTSWLAFFPPAVRLLLHAKSIERLTAARRLVLIAQYGDLHR